MTTAPAHHARAPWSWAGRLGTIAATLAVTAACGSAAVTTSPETTSPARLHPRATAPAASPTSWQPGPGESLVATAKHPAVVVTSTGTSGRRWRLHNPNASGAPLLFLVVGARPGAWKVRVPARPNGATGWVRDSDVDIAVDPYELRASLHRRVLSVYRNGQRVRDYTIGVGRPSAPTPTGTFFLTELLQAAQPDGPYGPYAYGTSAFSDVYSEFEGGPGQIGVHGTDDPSSIGRNVSHGCLRLHVHDIAAIAHQIPAGTPLTITK